MFGGYQRRLSEVTLYKVWDVEREEDEDSQTGKTRAIHLSDDCGISSLNIQDESCEVKGED